MGLSAISGASDGSWHDSGATVTLTAAQNVANGAGSRYDFRNWTGDVAFAAEPGEPGLGDDEPGPLDHGQLRRPVPAVAGDESGRGGSSAISGATDGSWHDSGATVTLTAAAQRRQRGRLALRLPQLDRRCGFAAEPGEPGLGDDEPGPLDHGQLRRPVPAVAGDESGRRSVRARISGASDGSWHDSGATVTLTAMQNVANGAGSSRYHFDNWTGDVGQRRRTPDNPVSVTMNQARSITANYSTQYKLSAWRPTRRRSGRAHISGGSDGS